MSPAGASEGVFYQTPEQAAVADVPEEYATVLWSEVNNNLAFVWVEENNPPAVHWSIDLVYRHSKGWRRYSSTGEWPGGGSFSSWTAHPGDTGYPEDTENSEEQHGIEIEFIPADQEDPERTPLPRINGTPCIRGYYIVINWNCPG